MRIFLMGTLLVLISGCPKKDTANLELTEAVKKNSVPVLTEILDAQDLAIKERYKYRNPKETLEFFGIRPGMVVVEALPGAGWYSKILISYLGDNGTLIGVDYPYEMWPEFGGRYAANEWLEKKKTWTKDWVESAQEWRGLSKAKIDAFVFGKRDKNLDGKVDAVLFVRALHNLSRFESKGEYLTTALADVYALLKSGGVVGIVQHQSPDKNGDEWANGSKGYLKKAHVKSFMKAAGFEFVAESDINENPKDIPGEEDSVWRLPPSLSTSKDDAELKARMEAIGESNRMTLLFKKP